ncbi:hypothetical protein AVEN_143349-1 [Araneus ventricosus]|uniref:Integrase zinc-binding domain-containing protein n=1 Tax=Araneus ventricosus TaxID=182803 RepID=A0A4Y2ADW0_ARAVE|nr:hypothetical protein AVEN_143349-1 [Araneus ventricosus]
MKTLSKTRERFYWDRLRADVEKWCRECHACGARKGPKTRTKGRLQRYNVGPPFERMSLDILGPFPVTTKGNRPIDYMGGIRNRLLDLNQKIILKPDAVPSVNLPLLDNGEDVSKKSNNFSAFAFTLRSLELRPSVVTLQLSHIYKWWQRNDRLPNVTRIRKTEFGFDSSEECLDSRTWTLMSSSKETEFIHLKSVEWTRLIKGVLGLVSLDPVLCSSKETEFLHQKSLEWIRFIRGVPELVNNSV